MRTILFVALLASVCGNVVLSAMYQQDERKLREQAQMCVKIYDSARQIIADLKANDPLTFTNVVVPAEIK